jgi:hypothetical protein
MGGRDPASRLDGRSGPCNDSIEVDCCYTFCINVFIVIIF